MSEHTQPARLTEEAPVTATSDWQRLSARIIWVDLLMTVLSISPAVLAIWVFGVDATGGQIWPLIGLAAFGIFGGVLDVLRWTFTRFRITASYVELKTGVVFRKHRSIQRDRIRSVDVEAKLRHRVARMRVVTIGAGQQTGAGEAALALDALSVDDAKALQHELLSEVQEYSADAPDENLRPQPTVPAPEPGELNSPTGDSSTVFARFEPTWFIYHMFNVWAYILALGLGWGALWLLSSFGLDVTGFVMGLLDWEAIGWVGTVVIAVVVSGALGAIGLGLLYFSENWNFELARVRGRDGTMLRTRKGLFTTREVNRDENRIRGIQISEPVLWRWMGVSDTNVITTGLDVWSMSEPAAILPRGPVRRAREVAGQVLGGEQNLFEIPLASHPRKALRRRVFWATWLAAGLAGILTWLAVTEVVPSVVIWAAAAFWGLGLLGAVVAYRALGHTLTDQYVITRSGLLSRSTTVLQRSAVSTIVIRESLLQRRLGLRTVSTMTAAGYGGYDTPDIAREESLDFAVQAAPGLLDPFLVPREPAQNA